MVKKTLRVLLAALMILAGVSHFRTPHPFVRIVPSYLPAPLALVYISGLFECLGGLGLLIPRLRKAAGLGLIALYFAVFPANVHMAMNNLSLGDTPVEPWLLWLRLPLQAVLIAWAYWVSQERATTR